MNAMTSTALSPFSLRIPRWQTSWDSTSLGWLKECPRKYAFHMILRWQSRFSNIHLMFGGLYASALERYAHAKAAGSTHDEATLAMVRWALEASGTRDAEGTFTPWGQGPEADSIKNRYTLIRTLVWNVEDRRDSDYHTLILANGKPAVELSFRFEAFHLDNEPIALCGHLDEVVIDPVKQIWIRDDKTSKNALTDRWWSQWSPSNQMSLYTLAGKIILGQPVAGVMVRGAHIGVNFSRFGQRPVPRPPAVLAEWLEETKDWIAQAHSYAQANRWPANDKSCGNYGGCTFQKVCSVSPSHRPAWLKDGFEQREWNPLVARGDI